MSLVTFDKVTKKFGEKTALENISTTFEAQRVVGLIGLNGSGKTTLLRHIVGLMLPTWGQVNTFDTPSDRLGPRELSRIGYVHQEHQFLEWMTVWEHINYISSFYERWDRDLEKLLLRDFSLNPDESVGTLSPGNVQKLAIIVAVCHSPDLLILDEPASALDPIARRRFLEFLMDVVSQRPETIIISSHVLTDIEKVVDHVHCLHEGRLLVDQDLDQLLESHEEWIVQADHKPLPETWNTEFILHAERKDDHALLVVDRTASDVNSFEKEHGLRVTRNAMNLERIFPFLIGEV